MLILLIDLYSLVLFVSVILSWLPLDEDNPLVRGIRAVTEPVLDPIRRVLPPMGGFDLSPMILLIALRLLKALLLR
jgi:YggT family protein